MIETITAHGFGDRRLAVLGFEGSEQRLLRRRTADVACVPRGWQPEVDIGDGLSR